MAEGRTISSRTRIALILLTLLLGSCGGGGGNPNPDPGDQRLTLSGRIVDAGGGGIANADVLLALNPAVTDAAGNFSFANLLPGSYTLSYQDGAGNFDARSVTLSAAQTSFTFVLPTDQSGLRAIRVSPALAEQNAELDSEIRMVFNQPLLASSLSASDFRITPNIGEFTLIVNNDEVILRPRLQLPPGQTLLVEATGQFSSVGGSALSQPLRWRFRTNTTDNAAPTLLDSNPDFGAENHPPNLAVSLEFNETLGQPGPAFSISSTPELELLPRFAGRFLFISAVGGFEASTSYSISISGITDLAGNLNSSQITLSFTTGDQPAPSTDIQPEWNANIDTVVFASNLLGNYDIFSVGTDGSELIQHTFSPADEQSPSLSSDGRLLTFQRREAGGRWRIYVQPFDGGDPVPVSSGSSNDLDPYFSRTASGRIAYSSDQSSLRHIFLIGSDGSNPQEQDFSFGGSESQPALHPLLDTQMLFTSGVSGNSDIWRKTVSAVDGSTFNINLTGDSLASERMPAWSQDAGFVLYISDQAGVDNLWRADAAGGFPRQITFFDQPLSDPHASPFSGDPRAAASLAADEGAGRSIVLIDLVSGGVDSILTGPDAGD